MLHRSVAAAAAASERSCAGCVVDLWKSKVCHGCLLLYAGAALYLGVLTSISPCPLATNIAAISYVGRKVGDSRSVMAAGLLYTLGRCLLYLALAVLLAATAMSIPAVSLFLQKYMHLVLGPIFLLLGMFLVGLITTNLGGASMTEGMQKRVDTMGVWGALPLGRAVCRVVLPDFGGMVLRPDGADYGFRGWGDHRSIGQGGYQPCLRRPCPAARWSLPVIYGVGTALPVLLVAFLLAYSAKSVGKTYNMLAKIEWWARQVTGWVFILAGIYFSLKYVFEIG